jgi:hypothetical protein
LRNASSEVNLSLLWLQVGHTVASRKSQIAKLRMRATHTVFGLYTSRMNSMLDYSASAGAAHEAVHTAGLACAIIVVCEQAPNSVHLQVS